MHLTERKIRPMPTPHCERDDSSADLEVTPEMLEAGLEEYALFDSEDPGEWVVTAIYRAMAKKAIEDRPIRVGGAPGQSVDFR
jgi:hypothetical protein